jgi:hypothetical protein
MEDQEPVAFAHDSGVLPAVVRKNRVQIPRTCSRTLRALLLVDETDICGAQAEHAASLAFL